MPADEVTHGADVDESRVRTGPRHAAPKKPLFTRLHMPAGKAIALAAMPTAVLMGMGFTPKLALAEDQPASRSLTADEYKECVAALEAAENGGTPEATPSPSASAGESEGPSDGGAEPSPSATSGSGGTGSGDSGSSEGDSGSGDGSSADSGSADDAEPTPSASASAEAPATKEPQSGPVPSPSETSQGVLETIGDTVTGVVGGVVDGITGGGAEESPSPTPPPSASASPSPSPSAGADQGDGPASGDSGGKDPVEETTGNVTDAVEVPAGTAGEATSGAVPEPTGTDGATTTPSPSASPTTDVDDCPVATDAEGGVDNPVPLPDDPWYLDASSLTLKGASYEGIVEVRTANGTVKKVLKYVISDGTDIGDLHQTVKDKQSGKTYHVQAARGSTSTIRDGDTVMYTESISGNLLGLIPVTFDPEHPPPLDIPLIYFTKVKVVQAGQFGGTLTVPGLHQYITD
ncbi:hypothetical protein [Streptomyces sp.]|uniref:hypothetical protein n=1 Tax=Streptomyces sp. TaxID=1931 RepID=UPI002D334840|nr:hypothetical protein [Streptomyces sp.]HZF93055.1 hypothetical protein [Streptomyces sp.]